MSEQPGRYQRTPGGLGAAMLVLLLAVGFFVLLRGCARGNQDTLPEPVPYAGLADQARRAGPLVAPAPDPLPGGWRATSVRFRPGARPTWHLGVLTAQRRYVAVEEAVRPAPELVATYLGSNADRGATVSVGGVTWRVWRRGTAYALTTDAPDSTVYVGGPAGRAAVLRLAATLDGLPRGGATTGR